MELLHQTMKKEMEECKRRARVAGLQFPENTLEYIVSNRDISELAPKNNIPTLYDYWIHGVETVRNRWIYDVFPHNPYETVINTRPPISFYNCNNADWLNVMIFYHVLGHIDFFQNNIFFRKTWDDDFCGQALADKRLLNRIRDELGPQRRWVDYLIEFSRAVDNLVGYHQELEDADRQDMPDIFGLTSEKTAFYFGQFLRSKFEAGAIELKFYHDEAERFNRCLEQFGKQHGETAFFEDNYLRSRFPEFHNVFKKWKEKEQKQKPKDILQYVMEHSEFLNKEENQWMRDVIQVIRRTSLYFQPQIRTNICNEGWASLWHERLYIADERKSTHEVGYAMVDSAVTMDPRIGINPYAIGKHLFEFIEDLARKGRLSREYQFLRDSEARRSYNKNLGEAYGKKVLFEARKYLDDYQLINFLSDEDFQDFVNKYRLFVVGIRPSREKLGMADVYIKTKNGREYRKLLNNMLYHPPYVMVNRKKATGDELYLDHIYEGRILLTEYIPAVLVGLEFLWGNRVKLETTERDFVEPVQTLSSLAGFPSGKPGRAFETAGEEKLLRVLYSCEHKKVTRTVLSHG